MLPGKETVGIGVDLIIALTGLCIAGMVMAIWWVEVVVFWND